MRLSLDLHTYGLDIAALHIRHKLWYNYVFIIVLSLLSLLLFYLFIFFFEGGGGGRGVCMYSLLFRNTVNIVKQVAILSQVADDLCDVPLLFKQLASYSHLVGLKSDRQMRKQSQSLQQRRSRQSQVLQRVGQQFPLRPSVEMLLLRHIPPYYHYVLNSFLSLVGLRLCTIIILGFAFL